MTSCEDWRSRKEAREKKDKTIHKPSQTCPWTSPQRPHHHPWTQAICNSATTNGGKKNMLNVKKHDAQRLYSIPKQMKEKSRVILLTCIIKSLPYLWRSFTNHQKITSQCQWDGFHPRLILVWMPLEGQLSVCLFDAIKLCIIGDAQYLSKHQWFNMADLCP